MNFLLYSLFLLVLFFYWNWKAIANIDLRQRLGIKTNCLGSLSTFYFFIQQVVRCFIPEFREDVYLDYEKFWHHQSLVIFFIKLPPKYLYLYSQTGLLLALIRETHCSTEQWWTLKIHVFTRYWNIIADDCLALNHAFISYPLHYKAQRILWNRNWKENKSWKIGGRAVKYIFLSRHVLCNPKFTADFIGSAQERPHQQIDMEWGGAKTIIHSLLNNHLLLIDSGRKECCL